jgi:hypothetical protein
MRYFSFGEDGFKTHETPEAAEAAADAEIEWFRDDAGDGWSEAVERVCWGEIRQHAVIVSTEEACSEEACEYSYAPDLVTVKPCNGHHRRDLDQIIDYGLVDAGADAVLRKVR